MNKNNMLLIGTGKTGNVLVNEMLERDRRYVGLMINSALGDMTNLKNYEIADHFLFAGRDGSGRNRDAAKDFVKKRGHSIVDTILKYSEQDVVVFFTSADGGTGSGSTPLIVRALKKATPHKTVIVVAVMPRLSENELSLKNSIEFWNDLVDLKNKDLVDTIYLIDNNKRRSFEDINKEAVDTLDMAFSLNTYDNTGTIDQNDSKRVNTAKGYSFVLPLSPKYTDIQDSIDQAIKDSVFMPPPAYECDYMGAVVQEKYYNVEDLKSRFEVYKVDYCGYSDKTNLIVLGGLAVPKDGIDILQMALRELEKRTAKKYVEEDLKVKIKDTEDKKEELKVQETKAKTATISAKELNNMFDDNFWDD